jgi:hypothetical protein
VAERFNLALREVAVAGHTGHLIVDLVRGEVELGAGRADSGDANRDGRANFWMISRGANIGSPIQ